MKNILFLMLLQLSISVDAQEYPVSAVSDSLKKNADAVVRYKENLFTQTDKNNATHKVIEVVTILNEDGKDYGNVVIYLDKFRDLKSFSGTVADASGKIIKKIGKKDLTATAYSSHIASDDKRSYYEYQSSSYPYTVRYEYEMKIKDGIPYYPKFVPMVGYDISVEKAKYSIHVPSDMKIRYKAERMPDGKPTVTAEGANTVYEWSVSNLSAIEKEPYSPELSEIVPVVRLAPNDFCMEGRCGNMSDWNNLGKWIDALTTGRGEISPQLKEKLTAITADAKDGKEKTERIFKYLQSTTRYVSIQLGIGGYQPMSAAEVEKSGFGDCKALSNYMQSMLTAVGIPSVYTVIGTDRENLYTDFSDLGQMDHVILAVPMPSDTLWLECTNPLLPFNYPHTDIAGHQCLLITPEGGKVCRVKKNSGADDSKSRCIRIEIDEAGNGKAHIKAEYKSGAYEGMQRFVHNMSREEQINFLASDLRTSKVRIGDLQIRPNDSEDPDLQLEYKADVQLFANKSGNRLFVPFSLLQPVFAPVKPGKRTRDIVLPGDILRTDTIQMTIPTGYVPESIPKSQVTAADGTFGEYSVDIRSEGNTIYVIQRIHIKKGRYPASAVDEFRAFFKNMEKEWGRRAVFKHG